VADRKDRHYNGGEEIAPALTPMGDEFAFVGQQTVKAAWHAMAKEVSRVFRAGKKQDFRAGSFDSERQVIEGRRVKSRLNAGRDFCSPTPG
jgi:hypothetical protein